MMRPVVCGLLCASFLGAQAHVIRSRTERRTQQISSTHRLASLPLGEGPARDHLGGGTTRAVADVREMQPFARPAAALLLPGRPPGGSARRDLADRSHPGRAVAFSRRI